MGFKLPPMNLIGSKYFLSTYGAKIQIKNFKLEHKQYQLNICV